MTAAPVLRRTAAIALAVVAVASASGCRVSDLAFRADDRIDIVAPDDRATVALPVVIRWEVKERPWPEDRPGSFAVFVDRAPIGPGSGLKAVAGDDEACKRTAGCPDAAYLASRGVYPTTEPFLEVPTVRDTRPSQRAGARDRHDATVVLLDAQGRRMGEAAFRVTFYVDREVPR